MWRRAAAAAVTAAVVISAAGVAAVAALPLHAEPRAISDPATACPDEVFTPEVVERIMTTATGRRVTAAVYDTRRRCWHHLAPGLQITTASVIKAEILAGVVLQARREGRDLTVWERDRASRMIRYSHDNPPTGELLAHIGGVPGMQRLDAELGATATTQSSVYGAVWTTATDRTLVTASLLWGGGPIDAEGRALAASFMDDVHPTQTWGVTGGVPAGHRVALKNGFYPMRGHGWRVGSTGLVRTPDGEGYVITVMTDRHADQASGVALVETVSTEVAAELLAGTPAARAVDAAVCVTTASGQSWSTVTAALGLPPTRRHEVRDVNGGNAAPAAGQRACSPDLAPRPVETCVLPTTRTTATGTGGGYVLLGSTGSIDSWGAPVAGTGCRAGTAVDIAADGTARWWVLTTNGSVLPGDGAAHHGDGTGAGWAAIAATGAGDGYWLATGRGTVQALGSAAHHRDAAMLELAAPVVDLVATPTGKGYWLAAADGGVFTFGDAAFHGSTGALALDEPIVGMAVAPSGNGYWLVAADGGVFTFGDAAFHGSTGEMLLDEPITAIVGSGAGYLLVGRDGGVFAFGGAAFLGGLGGTSAPHPIMGAARL